MILLPARRLRWAAAAVAALSIGLLLGPGGAMVLWVAVAALTALALADVAWLWRHRDPVAVALDVPLSRQRGETIDAAYAVTNRTQRPLDIEFRPELPEQGHPRIWQQRLRLTPLGGVHLTCPIAAGVRGEYAFGPAHVRVAGPLGLFQAQHALPASAACRVYPDVRRVREYIVLRRTHSVLAPHLRTARLRGIGSEFESLRDYERGDDIRRIDWRATAKHARLITRNYEIEPFRNVVILLDRGRLMAGAAGTGTKFDFAVDTALMIAAVALDGGDRCGLLVFDREIHTYLPPRGALPTLNTVVDALFNVQPVLEESHFRRAYMHLQTRLNKRSLVVVLTDVVDAEVSRSLLEGIHALGRRHLILFAAIRTPALYDTIAAPVDDVRAPFRKAVAYRLIRERADAMQRLQKGGAHVLDVAPEGLTVPLLNKYLELREQNRL